MKTLSIATIFACFFCINKFEIVEATSQKWHAGVEAAGYGTKYELTIVPNVGSDKLIFDRLWIGNKYFKVYSFQKGKKMRNNLFSKGDTITIMVNDRVQKRKPMPIVRKDDININKKYKVPYKYEGEALLSYTYKGKRKYKEIKKFTEKKELNYQ
ncbi:MAG: hypothetical protein GXO49_05780 [Chlorobi bacterium]|nr:hypothetical protein [Chlorobiota bacterium]